MSKPPPSITSTTKTKSQHVSLHKRLLFPSTTAVPVLFDNEELSNEVYDFVALALRAFVTPWWSKISRYDKEFLPDITRILGIVIPRLEQRVQSADIPRLALNDLPLIIAQHYRDFHNARSKLSSAYATGGAASLPSMFHALQPHIAITPEGTVQTEYYRQVLDVVLKVLLPEEDYEPEAERFIVREIILKVVCQDVLPKVTQPWFILKAISDNLKDVEVPSKPAEPTPSLTSQPFSVHTIIVFMLSAIQILSGVCIALIEGYKQASHLVKLVNQSPHSRPRIRPPSTPKTRDISITSPISIPNTPLSTTKSIPPSRSSSFDAFSPPAAPSISPEVLDAPIDYAHPGLDMFRETTLADTRLTSRVILTAVEVVVDSFSSFTSKLLPYVLMMTLSSPKIPLQIVRTLKRALFPNGYPVPAPPEPTPEEVVAMRNKIIHFQIPGPAAHAVPLFLGPKPEQTLSEMLDPLSDATCNLHLFILVLDCILLELFPELCNAPS